MTAVPHRGRRLLRRACAGLGLALALVVASGWPPRGWSPRRRAGRGAARPATATPAPAPGISVSGNRLLRDGEPFVPRGFNMIGLLTPDWCDRAPGIAAREHFGRPELAAARAWHAGTLRLRVSQRGLADPTGNLAYGIHPYFFTNGPAWWDLHHAAAAADVPLIATEWNYRADGWGTAQERLAPALLDHLRRHGIGVLGHAFDVPGTTVADWTWRPTACGTPSGGAGLALRTFFAGLAARD